MNSTSGAAHVMKTAPEKVATEFARERLLAVERIDALIGNTPLVKLNRIGGDDGGDIFVKMENTNPSGSIRDRYITEIIAQSGRSRAITGVVIRLRWQGSTIQPWPVRF